MQIAVEPTPSFESLCSTQQALRVFEQLQEFRPAILKLAKRLLARSEDMHRAEDIVQETYIRAYKSIANGKELKADGMLNWLSRIATRIFLDDIRYQNRRLKPFSLDAHLPEQLNGEGGNTYDAADDIDILGEHMQADELNRVLNHLKPESRELLLKYAAGMDYCELADLNDLSIGSTRSRVHRARYEVAYYGVYEGAIQFKDLQVGSQKEILRKLEILGREYLKNKCDQDGAELVCMLKRLRNLKSLQPQLEHLAEIANVYLETSIATAA